MELSELTHEVWSELVGETFRVGLDDGSTVELVLSGAELAPGDPKRNGGAHSAFFVGPSDQFLHQRMWPLFHESIGEHHIFLVPIGQDEAGFRYEAVFSRLAD